VPRAALINALRASQVMADFVGISPADQEALKQAMGDRIKFQENARVTVFQLVFNTTRKPFDDVRVRQALSLAIDRWTAAPLLRRTTFAGIVGGVLRPGDAMARPAEDLDKLPGFSRDPAAAQAEARRLLAAAGQEKLGFTLTNRAVDNLYRTLGVYLIDQWRQIGVTVEQDTPDDGHWNAARFGGNFDAIIEFSSDFADEPTLRLGHYLSHDRAPDSNSRIIDRTLDDIYDRQMRSTDTAERTKLVRAFEERVLQQAYVVPLTWGYRITPLAAPVMGYITAPAAQLGQDLSTVWLDR
jgi:peptide/nickel transport system substrate-binding protein